MKTPRLITLFNWIFVGTFLGEALISRMFLTTIPYDSWIHRTLGLIPSAVVTQGYVWQLATYMFFHGNMTHLLFNILAFWMFGSELCRIWKPRFFFIYFFACGIGAGLFHVASVMLFQSNTLTPYIPTIGASGAIYGILMAYGLILGHRLILFFFVIPMQARTAVLIMGAIEVFYSVSQTPDGIAHLAHLGGMVVGYIILSFPKWRHRWTLWRFRKQRNTLRQKLQVIVDNTRNKNV